MRGSRRGGVGGALLGLVVTAVMSCAVGVSPVGAVTSTVTGGGTFTLAVTLEFFPCPSICSSDSVSGTFAGQISGVDVNGTPYTATFPDPGAVPPVPGPDFASTNMTNSDVCVQQAQTAPAIVASSGTANIAFVISGGLLVRGGAVSHGAKVSGSIFLSRTSANGTIGISSPIVTDGAGATVATGALGAGDGVFSVPLADVWASCANQMAGITATISGTSLQFL